MTESEFEGALTFEVKTEDGKWLDKDGNVSDRRTLALPERVLGVIKCKNPRCITSVEQEIVHEFKLTDRKKGVYRCIYCEQKA